MFLSEFDINSGRRTARHLLASRERLHAAVLGCFPPGQSSDGESRALWRLDASASHAIKLLLVSGLRPDFTALNEQAGWTTGAPARTASYDGFLGRLAPGQTWRFRLTANPVRSVRDEPGARGRRVAHVTAAQQRHWLVERHAALGVEFPSDAAGEPSVAVTRRETVRFTRGAASKPVTLSIAQLDGCVNVVDPERLRAALVMGVGPAKGYGCGLMTLAPPNRQG
ncbi:type I-E CRISPR-associated protein Cas6/Cse3/CasE [Tessaracoccus flavescens]|uniref:Type I-E CRISPR-associated protein Cas6/Cse3/CasE n=1 Tax=Tessaracoccus flavescens TaxID=399497 RepID=A0A1Q2CX88_9ACTN|nr:type I-E CRISPR-associated protein Cas6/Cse3/CasE [Tessaracoccus flavescens]AQP50703.1 type I-E CRISPR-associated protein Cas6/Cse3/CasE [Tessaracoccus flavescens]